MNHIKSPLENQLDNDSALQFNVLETKYAAVLPELYWGWGKLVQQAYLLGLESGRIGTPEAFEPNQNWVKATPKMIQDHFDLTTLDSLKTDHMTEKQSEDFNQVIQVVRDWRNSFEQGTTRAMVLSSPHVGIGKTHIAKAIADSFSIVLSQANKPAYFIDGHPDFAFLRNGRMMTGKEIMKAMDQGDYSHQELIGSSTRCMVIDDLGREGNLQYEKRTEADQQNEKSSRYFDLINHIYDKRYWLNISPPALVITTNLTLEQLEKFFGIATWDRLSEMAKGHMIQLPKLPSFRQHGEVTA